MTLVVKIGGSPGATTANIVCEIAKCVAQGERIVILHGGSDLTNSLSERLGRPARMVTSPGGMVSRYTDSETAPAPRHGGALAPPISSEKTGSGLPGAKWLMDDFKVEAQRGKGTVVRMAKWLH